jgi:acetolactate synthase-1/2/3 large subunit
MSPRDVAELAQALAGARAPLVVTSFVGRNPAAVEELVTLCGTLGAGVLESVPSYVNFPHDHPLYQGNQWNEAHRNRALSEADVILVIDSDVPWIPSVNRPEAEAAIFHIDVDPLKLQMPLWYIPAKGRYAADAATALGQLNARLDGLTLDDGLVDRRRSHRAQLHDLRKARLANKERPGAALTAELLTAALRRRLTADTLIVNEGVSNYQTIFDHLGISAPGTMFTSGGGSLGWHGVT